MNIERPKSNQPIPPDAKKVFSGVLFDVYQWEQKMFDGSVATFEKLKRPDTVVVFPVLPNGRIILTEQEQPGKESFIGAAGGRVDAGEEVIDAAKRELLEETGYTAERLELWDARQPVGKLDWAVFTFVAKGLKQVAEPHLDAGERISLKLVTFDELIEIATDENFYEQETQNKFLEAKYDGAKKEELRKLFDPAV